MTKDFPIPGDDKVIVIDNFKLHSVSLTSEGYGVAGRIVAWHYEDKETHGHEPEVEPDGREVRPSEQQVR